MFEPWKKGFLTTYKAYSFYQFEIKIQSAERVWRYGTTKGGKIYGTLERTKQKNIWSCEHWHNLPVVAHKSEFRLRRLDLEHWCIVSFVMLCGSGDNFINVDNRKNTCTSSSEKLLTRNRLCKSKFRLVRIWLRSFWAQSSGGGEQQAGEQRWRWHGQPMAERWKYVRIYGIWNFKKFNLDFY